MTYAIVKTGGKQYRVEEGQTLLVERLRAAEGDTVPLEPLLFRGDKDIVDGDDLAKVKVAARVVGHERGPKLRVLKFKPKKGYKRRTGHRQELTRLEVTEIKLGARRAAGAAKKDTAGEEKPKAAARKAPAAKKAPAKKPAAKKPAASRSRARKTDEEKK
jgi:large subunit ribosomal protein L21